MATGNHLGRYHHLGVRASAGASTAPSNYRRVLGVGPNASQRDVKTAYRRLARELHPDVCRGETRGVRFLDINRAYESLMNLMGSSSPSDAHTGAHSSYYENSSKYSYYPPQRSSKDEDPWADFLQSLVKPEQSTGNSSRASTSSPLEGNW